MEWYLKCESFSIFHILSKSYIFKQFQQKVANKVWECILFSSIHQIFCVPNGLFTLVDMDSHLDLTDSSIMQKFQNGSDWLWIVMRFSLFTCPKYKTSSLLLFCISPVRLRHNEVDFEYFGWSSYVTLNLTSLAFNTRHVKLLFFFYKAHP